MALIELLIGTDIDLFAIVFHKFNWHQVFRVSLKECTDQYMTEGKSMKNEDANKFMNYYSKVL